MISLSNFTTTCIFVGFIIKTVVTTIKLCFNKTEFTDDCKYESVVYAIAYYFYFKFFLIELNDQLASFIF